MDVQFKNPKWYDKTGLVAFLCILFFPVGLYGLWKSPYIKKEWKIIVTVFIAIVVINIINDKDEIPNKSKTVSTANSSNPEEKKLTEVELQEDEIGKEIEFIKREIKSVEDGIDFTKYKNSIESLQLELVLFNSWGQTIEKALVSENKELKSLGQNLEIKVKKLQLKEFPNMRKAYKDIVYQKLWVEDIETAIMGKRLKTLQFTGRIFAGNKAKQQTQDALSEILKMLRFKTINYKWYKYDDEYTYFTLDTPPDDALVTFK